MIYVFVALFLVAYMALLCWLSISLAEQREGTTIKELRKREAQQERMLAWQILARKICDRLDQTHLARSHLLQADAAFAIYEQEARKLQNHEAINKAIVVCIEKCKQAVQAAVPEQFSELASGIDRRY
jgi:hypothetical protein